LGDAGAGDSSESARARGSSQGEGLLLPLLAQLRAEARTGKERWSCQNGVVTRGMTETRWFPQHQPQTLQIAVALLYWNAALGLIIGILQGGTGRFFLLLLVAEVAGALGVANERKWGYAVALAAALLPFVLLIATNVAAGGLINIIFEIALVALLLHPMSRNYYKIWFR
jgi:hypothetical protein